MKRNATAVWYGNLKEGSGKVTTESGTLGGLPYSFSSRFEQKAGTNPEELIAAAHASCFSMALSAELTKVGLVADSIETQAVATLERVQDGWSMTSIHLKIFALIPGASEELFSQSVEKANLNCPVSKLLHTKITLQTELSSSVISLTQEAG